MTRAIILAAGFGSRLMPLTADQPKGMVKLAGMPLLYRQLNVLRMGGIHEIAIVGGYCSDRLARLKLPLILNPDYDTTNMVTSLMCAMHLLDGTSDVIVAYGDIVYEPKVIASLLQTDGDMVVVADKNWRNLWEARMDDPSGDVESFRVEGGRVIDLGRKPKSLDEVEGQYIGLIKIPARKQRDLVNTYLQMDREAIYDGQPFARMYMTSFIQYLIDAGWSVIPAWIENGWIEVDTIQDLEHYQAMENNGQLSAICDLSLTAGLNEARDESIAKVRDVSQKSDRFELDGFIRSQLGQVSLDTEDLLTLDKLARKIEIAGTLYQAYSSNFKSTPDAEIASAEAVDALLMIFLMAFHQTGDWRYLNTVLKAVDGVLKQPRPASSSSLKEYCLGIVESH